MKLSLETIILFGVNMKSQRHFYADILGLTIVEEEDNWILFQAGSANIALHKISPEYLDDSEGPFSVDNNVKMVLTIEEDIHETRSQLLTQGVRMKEVMTWEGYGYNLCDGRDPEGNVFRLKQKRRDA